MNSLRIDNRISPIAVSFSTEDVSGTDTTTSGSALALAFEDERGEAAPSPIVDECKGGGGGILRTLALNLLPLVNATIKGENYTEEKQTSYKNIHCNKKFKL